MTSSETVSYYDQLGGTPTIKEAVDRFYRLVLDDGDLTGYFAGVDVAQLKAHQVRLLSHVLGGPNGYGGRDLAAAHGHLGISEAHYQKVGAYLTGVLATMGASEEIVSAVDATLASVAPQIVKDGDGPASGGGAA
jgi:hemoglobin